MTMTTSSSSNVKPRCTTPPAACIPAMRRSSITVVFIHFSSKQTTGSPIRTGQSARAERRDRNLAVRRHKTRHADFDKRRYRLTQPDGAGYNFGSLVRTAGFHIKHTGSGTGAALVVKRRHSAGKSD